MWTLVVTAKLVIGKQVHGFTRIFSHLKPNVLGFEWILNLESIISVL